MCKAKLLRRSNERRGSLSIPSCSLRAPSHKCSYVSSTFDSRALGIPAIFISRRRRASILARVRATTLRALMDDVVVAKKQEVSATPTTVIVAAKKSSIAFRDVDVLVAPIHGLEISRSVESEPARPEKDMAKPSK
mmetsp:Transcript_94150/g.196469  ORF Transcript_94150/g.196469 Transcript_94150/m.196469 type:complete len:136 (+) Transcript_94150:119-526(+)